MNHRQLLRIISGVFAAIFGVSTVGIYFAWTADLLGPIGDRASDPTFRFYLLYIVTLILAGQALTGLPVWTSRLPGTISKDGNAVPLVLLS